MEFLAGLSSILILAIIGMADQLRKFYRDKKIKKWVSWVVVYDAPYSPSASGHDMPIWMYIHNAQIKLNIQEEYRISSDEEWQFVKEIVQELQNNLMQSYFKGHLGVIKSKYEIRGEHYFMYKLGEFLEKHERDHEFLGYDMRNYCDPDYSLTDFSIAYFKLYYVVYLFCKKCKPLNESGMRYSNKMLLEWIEEKIQTANGKEGEICSVENVRKRF